MYLFGGALKPHLFLLVFPFPLPLHTSQGREQLSKRNPRLKPPPYYLLLVLISSTATTGATSSIQWKHRSGISSGTSRRLMYTHTSVPTFWIEDREILPPLIGGKKLINEQQKMVVSDKVIVLGSLLTASLLHRLINRGPEGLQKEQQPLLVLTEMLDIKSA